MNVRASKALRVLVALVIVESALFLLNSTSQTQYEGTQLKNLYFVPGGQTVYGLGTESGPKGRHGWLWAWEMKTGRLLWKNRIPESLQLLKFSPDGEVVIVNPPNGGLTLCDARTGRIRCWLESGPAGEFKEATAFTPDSKYVVSCFKGGIQVWDARTGLRTAFMNAPKEILGTAESVQFSPDGTKLLVGIRGPGRHNARTLQLWDSWRGKLLKTFEEGSTPYALSPSGNKIAFVSSSAGGNSSIGSLQGIVLHDIRTGALRVQSPEFSSSLEMESLEFVSENRVLCKGSETGNPAKSAERQIVLWDIRENRITEQPGAYNRVVSPDNRLKIELNRGGYQYRPPLATVYDVTTGEKLYDLEGQAGR